jgi:spermidine synthase
MAAPISFWKRIESYLFPVSIRKGSSTLNPVLELFYYQGRYILATQGAVYSDGNKYRPILKAFNTPGLKRQLPRLKKVLVLGTGLASAVHILHSKNFNPEVRLVEIDATVLAWAKEFLPETAKPHVHAVHDDAFAFIVKDTSVYDLIIVDIFFGRIVPEQVTSSAFIRHCKARLNPDGFLVLNYMERPNEGPGKAKAALEAAFNSVTEICFGINRVYIVRA